MYFFFIVFVVVVGGCNVWKFCNYFGILRGVLIILSFCFKVIKILVLKFLILINFFILIKFLFVRYID